MGSGDAEREALPFEEEAPPFRRNGTQDRFGARTGVAFGAGTGSGGVSRRGRESRRRLDPWEGVGEVKPGDGRRDLDLDLWW
jgi:hypothetical protein